jgi:hypothetical protein
MFSQKSSARGRLSPPRSAVPRCSDSFEREAPARTASAAGKRGARAVSNVRPGEGTSKKVAFPKSETSWLMCSQHLAHSFIHSFAFSKWQNPCFQSTAHSFAKNTRGGGRHLMRYLRISLDDIANPCIMNTSIKPARNPSRMNTYKNTRLRVVQN